MALGLLSGGVVAECGARLFFPQYGIESMGRPVPRLPARWNRPSALLGWEKISTLERPLDAWGFLTEHDARREKEPDEVRVAMIGDSVGEWVVHFPQLRALEQGMSEAWGKQARLWYMGQGGYDLPQYAEIVAHRAPKIRADVVMVMFCLNDLTPAGVPVVWEENDRLYMIRGSENYMERRPVFLRELFLRSQLYRTFQVLTYGRAAGPEEEREFGKRHFRRIVEQCAAQGAQFVAVVYPLFKPYSQYDASERRRHESIRRFCRDHDVPLLDLHRWLTGDLSRYKKKPWDAVHPKREGHDECLRVVVEGFREPDRYFEHGLFRPAFARSRPARDA